MPPKYKAFVVLIVIILLFILNIKTSLILTFATLISLFFSEPKLTRFFINPGFLIFTVIALGIPLLSNFSFKELQQNLFVLSRGILITLWIYLYTKKFTSSNTYKKIRQFLPDELIGLINISSGIITVIQEKTFKEFLKIKNEKMSLFNHIVNFFYSFTKLAETVSFSTLISKKIILLTGEIHEGKTTFASSIVKIAKEANFKIGGILAKAQINNGERIGYYAENIKTGQSVMLITKENVKEYYDKFWSYFFLKEGMDFAQKVLSPEYLHNTDMVIIDEIGAMELKGRGYSKQLSALLNSKIPVILMVVRKQFIENICQKYNITPFQTVKVGENPETIVKMIQDNLY